MKYFASKYGRRVQLYESVELYINFPLEFHSVIISHKNDYYFVLMNFFFCVC